MRDVHLAIFHTVFGLHPEFEHVELQHTDHTDSHTLHAVTGFKENLDCAFLRDLVHALGKLLALHGIDLFNDGEMLRRKGRNSFVLNLPARHTQGISDGENTRIKDADDIACVSLVHNFPVLRHDLLRLGQTLLSAALHMVNLHAGGKLAGTDTDKRDTVPVCLVHICLDLEYKSRKLLFHGINQTHVCLTGQRRSGHL